MSLTHILLADDHALLRGSLRVLVAARPDSLASDVLTLVCQP